MRFEKRGAAPPQTYKQSLKATAFSVTVLAILTPSFGAIGVGPFSHKRSASAPAAKSKMKPAAKADPTDQTADQLNRQMATGQRRLLLISTRQRPPRSRLPTPFPLLTQPLRAASETNRVTAWSRAHGRTTSGTPYRYGAGNSRLKTGFNCSGFVRLPLWRGLRTRIPRMPHDMVREGTPVARSDSSSGETSIPLRSPRHLHPHRDLCRQQPVRSMPRTSGSPVMVTNMDVDYHRARYNGGELSPRVAAPKSSTRRGLSACHLRWSPMKLWMNRYEWSVALVPPRDQLLA